MDKPKWIPPTNSFWHRLRIGKAGGLFVRYDGSEWCLDFAACGSCIDLTDGKRQAIAAARKLHRELGEALDAMEAEANNG